MMCNNDSIELSHIYIEGSVMELCNELHESRCSSKSIDISRCARRPPVMGISNKERVRIAADELIAGDVSRNSVVSHYRICATDLISEMHRRGLGDFARTQYIHMRTKARDERATWFIKRYAELGGRRGCLKQIGTESSLTGARVKAIIDRSIHAQFNTLTTWQRNTIRYNEPLERNSAISLLADKTALSPSAVRLIIETSETTIARKAARNSQ